MRSAIIENGVVVNAIVGSIPGSVECPPEVGPGWTHDGEAFAPPPAPEPDPPTIDDYRAAIEAHIDATARARDYGSAVSCASYVASLNPVWAAEAMAFVAWRDSVWEYAFAELAEVEAGAREEPGIAEFIAELPAISWPE